jgi:uncharacterized membrane protein
VKSILIVYTATLIALLVVDLAYLATLGIKLFKNQLGPGVLREKPAISAAILFYLIYVAGVVFLRCCQTPARELRLSPSTAPYLALLGMQPTT